jgi:hypothetical protein
MSPFPTVASPRDHQRGQPAKRPFKNHETRFRERAQWAAAGDVGRARRATFVWNWLVVSPDNEIPLQVKRSTHDLRWSKTMLHLSESDLRFLVETVATNRRDYDHVTNLIRDKEDLLEPMLDDPKLTERLFCDEEALVRVTPHMLFSVLLRRLRRELEKEAYVLDVDTKGKRIPVFEGPAVAEMLSDKQTRDYLVEMLSSFARTNSGIIYWKERGTWHKRRFSDIDLDDMVELARIIDPEMRPALYKRIADIALFLSGIFPEHAVHSSGSRKTIFSAKRTLKDYEQVGKLFYNVAARETDQTQWKPVLGTLAEKFTLARLALNSLSDRYVKTLRARYFRSPAES